MELCRLDGRYVRDGPRSDRLLVVLDSGRRRRGARVAALPLLPVGRVVRDLRGVRDLGVLRLAAAAANSSHLTRALTSATGGDRMTFDTIERAIEEIAAGRAVVVVDDEDRENEGDLIAAASKVTPELVAFMVRHTSGVLCVPMQSATLDRLGLPPMTARNEDAKQTAYTVSVDARRGVTTGISAADRAH